MDVDVVACATSVDSEIEHSTMGRYCYCLHLLQFRLCLVWLSHSCPPFLKINVNLAGDIVDYIVDNDMDMGDDCWRWKDSTVHGHRDKRDASWEKRVAMTKEARLKDFLEDFFSLPDNNWKKQKKRVEASYDAVARLPLLDER